MTKLIDITGKAISGEWGSDDETGEGTPVLRTTNFTNNGVVDYSDVVTRNLGKKDLSGKYLRHGDIIIEKSGGSDNQPVGRVIYFDGPENTFLFNNFTGLLRIKDQSCWLPRYVFYALFANYRRGGTKLYENRTTGLHNLQTDSYVSRTNIPEADIKEQRRISNSLDRVNDIIIDRQRQLASLDELIKARFVEMFIGRGYPRVSIDDLSLGKGEYGAQSASVEYDPSRPRYVRITDINDDGTLNDDVVSSVNPEDDEPYRLSYGDFLFARMGATVGKTYAYREGYQIYAGYLIRYKLDLSKITPEYLFAYTRLEEYWNWVRLNQSGAAQPGINAKKYGALQVPVAPLPEQMAFQDFVSRVDKSRVVVQKALDEAQLLFDSLMQKYFG